MPPPSRKITTPVKPPGTRRVAKQPQQQERQNKHKRPATGTNLNPGSLDPLASGVLTSRLRVHPSPNLFPNSHQPLVTFPRLDGLRCCQYYTPHGRICCQEHTNITQHVTKSARKTETRADNFCFCSPYHNWSGFGASTSIACERCIVSPLSHKIHTKKRFPNNSIPWCQNYPCRAKPRCSYVFKKKILTIFSAIFKNPYQWLHVGDPWSQSMCQHYIVAHAHATRRQT